MWKMGKSSRLDWTGLWPSRSSGRCCYNPPLKTRVTLLLGYGSLGGMGRELKWNNTRQSMFIDIGMQGLLQNNLVAIQSSNFGYYLLQYSNIKALKYHLSTSTREKKEEKLWKSKYIPTHESHNETWLSQFGCPFVKVMGSILMHQIGKKPAKHKVW